MRVLAVNAGSSSLKLRLLDDQDATIAEQEKTIRGNIADLNEFRERLTIADVGCDSR